MAADPNDTEGVLEETPENPQEGGDPPSTERLATDTDGRQETSPEGGRRPVGADERTMRVGRELIDSLQAEIERDRLHRADTLPLPGSHRGDDPTPARGTPLPLAPPLSVAPPGATMPGSMALADTAAAGAAIAAVSAGITIGSFVAGTFGWAPPLLAACVGAVAITVVYLTARKIFTRMLRSR